MFHKRDKSKEKIKDTDIIDNINMKLKSKPELKDEDVIEHPFTPTEYGDMQKSSKPNSRANSRERLYYSENNHEERFFSELEKDEPFKSMIANGLGKILVKTTAHIDEMAKKANLNLPKTFLNETCQDFNRFMEDLDENIAEHINNSILDIEQKIANKVAYELKSHNEKRKSLLFDNHSESFYPPPFRQPNINESEILSDHKLTIVNNTFPIRQKFSGNNSPSITEFLRNVITAQQQCDLTENQFKNTFLRCVTGPVYEHVSSLMDGNVTIPEIFNSLLIRYDNRLKPEEAQKLLETYSLPRNADFNMVVSNIMSLAQRAAQMHPRPSRDAVYNFAAINCLQKHLPADSQSDGRKVFADLNCELGHTPSFDEYVRALRRYATSIDYNYKKEENRRFFKSQKPMTQNKPHYNMNLRTANIREIKSERNFIRSGNTIMYKNPVTHNKTRAPQNSFPIDLNVFNYNKYNTPNNYKNQPKYPNTPNKQNNSAYGNTHKNNQYNTTYKPKHYANNSHYTPNKPSGYNKYNVNYNNNSTAGYRTNPNLMPKPNKKYIYCALCGKHGTHTSQDYCYEMRTNAGHFRYTSTVEAPCETCKTELKKDLFHPSYLCFNRPRAKYLKANNQWNPPTAEQREEMRRNALQNHI